MSFKIRMAEVSRKRQTNIVLALDFPFQNPKEREKLLARAQSILDLASPHICAVKINHHLTLPLGIFDGVQILVNQARQAGLLTIMDGKVNDIGATNQTIAEYYYEAGFDALIVNPFIGWEEGLKPIFEVAGKHGRGIILLTYMSHKGAVEGYGQTVIDGENRLEVKQYLVFAHKALKYKADGVVVGATAPDKIREVYQILGSTVPIYSPGIGAQGGEISAATKAGASYLIVGREIVQAPDAAGVAEKFKLSARKTT
ncbi:MAG: orotidine 5'-phosphate decarboxylase [Candidatus Bathyarchaeota archaeon]|nr:orotidine 5'-phosphate decarboxylase [Candidatus Bathyarchaeota archaeon]